MCRRKRFIDYCQSKGEFLVAKNKNKNVVIAYYPGADKADMAAGQLKAWDKNNKAVKLGGIGILTWQDGKIKTRKVGTRDTGKGAGWGTALGAAVGILSGGVTLIGGALVGAAAGAATGALFHKGLGLSDEDKTRLEDHLKSGGAAVVVMADGDEVDPTQAELSKLGGAVENYVVPEENTEKLDAAEDVPPPDESDDDESA
jgi:uncharacterized membrane protein